MRYEISQKLWTFGDDFGIRDETGRDRYYVDGKAFSFGKQLSFQDDTKKEVAFISQKVFAFTPTFRIKKQGRVVAILKKKFMTVRPQFILDVPGPNDYLIVGDFFGHEYTIKQDSRDVARISKRFFSFTDSYGVDISGGDTILFLCAVVIIDLVLHNKKN